MPADHPEVAALLDTCHALLDGKRRLALLTERLAARASRSADKARDAHQEIETTRRGIERLDAMLTLRRQDLRPM
jgi:hypothetical protein